MCDTVRDSGKRIWSTLLLLAVTGVLFLYNWIGEAVADAHALPKVKRQDIRGLTEDSHILSEQTGLSESAVVELIRQGRETELSRLQEIYFAPVQIESIRTTPLTVSEWLSEDPVPGYEGMPMVNIQNGDILITKNSRFLGWRNGHAGLVVDAENGLVLEAIMLGSPSQLCKIDKWESYPSFLVLRLREEFMLLEDNDESQHNTTVMDVVGRDSSDATAENIAAYASAHLPGVPYQLLAGVFKEESLSGTQCAHLVWYAYKQFGIDLDSDGGLFVTPYDIQNSPYLEIVQSYGY